ncbi:translocase [Fluviibacterium sp. DFM31]|uniref:Protein translocase subunit SecA n=1 Tax=Meridianimarinicoccus marinus TaxID=3231483 RepID=A0ABV3L3K0_9RHOB
MSDLTAAPPLRLPQPEVYPEKTTRHHTALDHWLRWRLSKLQAGGCRWRAHRFRDVVARTRNAAPPKGLSDDELRARAAALSDRLRAGSWPPRKSDQAAAFALVREAAGRLFGTPHYDVQVQGAAAMVAGMVAEMATGEGKTLTATLAAVTAGLAGIPVHVITANDYLAARDAEEMEPIYAFFGLRTGVVVHGVEPPTRRAAYRSDITYCCNKEAAFDYLRDRLVLRERGDNIHLRAEGLYGVTPRRGSLTQAGLPFAIVDEADSVLIDEARIPLIISRTVPATGDAAADYTRALDLARAMTEGTHYRLYRAEGVAEITEQGREILAGDADGVEGPWRVPLIREELVRKALTALHVMRRGEGYVLREGKVQIVDEYTGRLMPDRSWSEGLHQMVELKEGVELTAGRDTLARMTYQRYFGRYRWIAGMTGTARPVATELLASYGLRVATIPTNRPPRRTVVPARVFPTAAEKWQAVADRVAAIHDRGAPVLIGTRSVEASLAASDVLTVRGVAHVVLNADQDEEEAAIVAAAGQVGAVTVATNMAGRGTDIKLGPGAEDLGGLHVIATERHDSARIDRQLAGRAARQGQPGRVETFLSLEDDLLAELKMVPQRTLAALGAGDQLFSYAQRRAERRHQSMRRELLRIDTALGDMLAFAGKQE